MSELRFAGKTCLLCERHRPDAGCRGEFEESRLRRQEPPEEKPKK